MRNWCAWLRRRRHQEEYETMHNESLMNGLERIQKIFNKRAK